MNTPAYDCAAAMLEALPAAMRNIRQHMRCHRVPGTSVPQFRVLGFLDRYGPATLSAVAEHIGTTLPSASRMVQSLVERQLVERHAGSPDRRTICLEITAKGHRVLEIARKATLKQLAGQVGSLTPREIARLKEAMGLLRRVVAAGGGQREPRENLPPC